MKPTLKYALSKVQILKARLFKKSAITENSTMEFLRSDANDLVKTSNKVETDIELSEIE